MSGRVRRKPPVREVVVPERKVVLPAVIPEEKLSLAELVEQVRLSGGWVPKKPDRTVFNFGHDIRNKPLDPGVWTKIFTLPAEYSPFIVYWKVIVADSPLIRCLSYMEGRPLSPRGIDLMDLYNNVVWQVNDRVWCHVYDDLTVRYGLTFNEVEPVIGDYDFYVRNYDNVRHNLLYLYFKWYQWEKRRVVEVE